MSMLIVWTPDGGEKAAAPLGDAVVRETAVRVSAVIVPSRMSRPATSDTVVCVAVADAASTVLWESSDSTLAVTRLPSLGGTWTFSRLFAARAAPGPVWLLLV